VERGFLIRLILAIVLFTQSPSVKDKTIEQPPFSRKPLPEKSHALWLSHHVSCSPTAVLQNHVGTSSFSFDANECTERKSEHWSYPPASELKAFSEEKLMCHHCCVKNLPCKSFNSFNATCIPTNTHPTNPGVSTEMGFLNM